MVAQQTPVAGVAVHKTNEQKAIEILRGLKDYEGRAIAMGETEWLGEYIALLQRQAVKAKNQRWQLRQLNKTYLYVKQEMVMLRQMQNNVLRAAVGVLKKSGFAVLEPKLQKVLKQFESEEDKK